jgi:uncharacterized protein involved in outer membrane biogenesis
MLLWLFAGTSILLAVLTALLFFVDVNLYRAPIERHVSTAFGREVVFGGSLKLQPSLRPRFAVSGVKITNPAWASRPFLAVVDRFEVRVGLLPLLRGELEIDSLEFHGVDLLLERAADGSNNFTFAQSGQPTALPAIEHMALYDATIGYIAAQAPLRRLHVEQLTARKVPGEPVELAAHTTVNEVPVSLSVRGEPPGDSAQRGPWRLTLLGEAGELALRIEGGVSDLTDWSQGEYRLELKGPDLKDVGDLSGYRLPEAAPFELSAKFAFKLDEYLRVSGLGSRFGDSEMRGELHWNMDTPRPVIRVELASQRLDTADFGLAALATGTAARDYTTYLDSALDIAPLADLDLRIEAKVKRVNGLAKPLQDLLLSAHADQQRLRVATLKATLDDTHITASAELPWGEHLTSLAAEAVSVGTLLQHAELHIHAQARKDGYRYTGTPLGRPLALGVSSVEASARPGEALTIAAEGALNDRPVSATLKAEPLAALVERPTGPWRTLTLQVQGEDARLDASGSVAQPFEAEGFDVSFTSSGTNIATLLPSQGAWSISGRYSDQADHRVFDPLKLTIGSSDIGGRVALYPRGQRTSLVANLEATRVHLDEILPDNAGNTMDAAAWDQQMDLDGLSSIDLDADIRIQRLQGLAKPMQDIRLQARADEHSLALAPVRATLDGIPIEAQLQLPWGERLATAGTAGVSVRQLMRQADLHLKAQPPEGKLQRTAVLMGQPVNLGLDSFEASVRPGAAIRVSADAAVDHTPFKLSLQAEPLANLLQRPTGPWRDLVVEVHKGDIRFRATGSVERPFEAEGFNVEYTMSGAEIEKLLPVFDMVLPLEGAYSLTGHFADLPDRAMFDALQIRSGGSDIGGRISVYQGRQRPKVVAQFHSEQLYLSKLLPVSDTQVSADAEHRVIPDYELPIERMREIDGELEFKGKRLRTAAGDLGDIRFRATLQDGVFRLDPFEVRGWAGARIESDGLIDASRSPPLVEWNWIARELNYGVLLEQAGFAETVEGTLDVTLRLSGKGGTRREFLGDADGQLIIVGQEGRFGSRRLDLWGSDLVTTMLSREWRRDDVTDLNCVVARIDIEDGLASSDKLLIDTQRITIGASGTLDLESEQLDLVLAPQPKRTSLLSLASPVQVTGTLAEPVVAVTVLPRRRMAAAGTGALAGLINPGYLIFTFAQTGSGQANACATAVEQALALKGTSDERDEPASAKRERFSLFPGCTRNGRRPAQ